MRKTRILPALAALLLLAVSALALPLPRPPTPRVLPVLQPISAAAPWQVGLASWYGADFQGRETTSGEPFDMFALTAAHRTLPFGTLLRITNLLNGRALVLRINDRGPVPHSRIVDVSFAVAQRLGFVVAGIVPVRLDIVRLPAR